MKFLTIDGKLQKDKNGKLITVSDGYTGGELLTLSGKILKAKNGLLKMKKNGDGSGLYDPSNGKMVYSWDELFSLGILGYEFTNSIKPLNKTALSGKLVFPKTLTGQGKNISSFSGCSNLTEVILPESYSTVRSQMFYNCTALQKITLPKNLQSIDSSAFQNCYSLSELVIESNQLTYISSMAFDSNLTLYLNSYYYGDFDNAPFGLNPYQVIYADGTTHADHDSSGGSGEEGS